MDNVALGSILRGRRAAAGRTIASVAVEAGLSVPYIANLENGRGNPTLAALDSLARALGTQLTVSLVDDQASTFAGSDRTRVDRLLRHPGLTTEAQRLAETSGHPLPQVREHFITALEAISRLSPEPLTDRDVDRLVDLVILATRRTE